MWTTDDLGSDEKGRICALVRFINDARYDFHHFKSIASGDKFSEMMELISNCPKRGIRFKIYKADGVGGVFIPGEYMGVDEIVAYLFDKVELNMWKVTYLEYAAKCLYGGTSRLDLVNIWISNTDKEYDLPEIRNGI